MRDQARPGMFTVPVVSAIAGIVALLARPSAAAARRNIDFSSARRLIQAEVAAQRVPGVAVAVVRRGRVLWEEGFGWADRESRLAATKDTMFNVASVTKSFTATALMTLARQKRLDLDRSVNEYLRGARLTSPMFDPSAATVRQAAMHTAGLTTFARTCYADEPTCRISMDETIDRYGVIFWPPGDHFDYSNLGYGILGEVVASASGKSLHDFFRDELFQPLGMTHSSLGVDANLGKYAAARYSSQGRSPHQETATPGASGAYSSAHDLALFGMFQLKAGLAGRKAILSGGDIDSMQNTTVAADGGNRYGLGWWVKEDLNGYRVLLAQGGTSSASASLELIPSEGIAVAVLVNTGSVLPSKVIDAVLSEMLPKYRANLEIRSKEPHSEKPDSSRPPHSLVGDWNGTIQTYRGSLPLRFTIPESGAVRARLGDQPEVITKDTKFDSDFGTMRMQARMPGSLAVEDAGPTPYELYFELYIRSSALAGCVTTRPPRDAPRGNLLSFWVELRRGFGTGPSALTRLLNNPIPKD